jgi:hypothetical protein
MIYNAAVLHLPVDISTKIFVVWLNLRWVARLDSASDVYCVSIRSTHQLFSRTQNPVGEMVTEIYAVYR